MQILPESGIKMSSDARHKTALQFANLMQQADALGPENPGGALPLYEQAFALKPKSAAVNSALGLCCFELGQTSKALTYLKNAVTLEPTSVKHRLNLASAFLASKPPNSNDALQALSEALSLTTWPDPDLRSLLNVRGVVEVNLGRYSEAAQSFLRALQICRRLGEEPDLHLLHNCANVLLKIRRAGDAVPLFGLLVEQEPDSAANLCNYAIALTESKQFEQAVKVVSDGLKRWPNDSALLLQQGLAYRGMQRLTRAAGSFTKAAELDSSNELAWLMKGLTLDDMQKHAKSVEAFDAALKLNPNNKEAWCNRGVAFLQMNDGEEAISSFDRALQIDPTFYDALANKAYALIIVGKNIESLQAYENLLKIDPNDATSLASKAIVLYNLQRYPESVEAVYASLVIDPQNEKAREIWPVISTFATDSSAGRAIEAILK